MGLNLLPAILGVILALAVGFGGIQTFNLRACQRQYAEAVAKLTHAIEMQNAKVSEWEAKAKQAQARAAEAGKKAAETIRLAKKKELSLLGASKPSAEASCEERETKVLALIRQYRSH